VTQRERLLAPHRLAIAAVVVALALVALIAARGPAWLQRLYHPLRYQPEISAAARRHGVDPFLVAGVIASESGYDASIVSRAGAIGLMQVLPSTARELSAAGVVHAGANASQLTSPAVNVEYGTAYLGQLMRRFDDTRTALAAYNAGPATVAGWLHRPGGGKITYADVAFPETKRYVKRVLLEAHYYKLLYPEAFK
jgi:soluble lytic murein transglycosylase